MELRHDPPSPNPTPAGGEDEQLDSREIFPNTVSMYKAFIDRIPTPITAPNESAYLEYSRTLSAAKEASEYALKNWKQRLDKQIAQSNQQAVQKALEGLLKQKHVYNAKSTDGVLNEPNTGVLAVPIESIQALKDTYDKKVQ